MARQIGLFFLLVGVLGLILFYTTIHGDKISWLLGLLSLLSAVSGFFIILKSYTPAETDERFRSYRKYRERRQEKKEEKN